MELASIIDGTPVEELRAAGFVDVELTRYDPERERSFTEVRWSHRNGDDHGVRVVVGLIDGRAEHADAQRRGDEMLWRLEHGEGRMQRRIGNH